MIIFILQRIINVIANVLIIIILIDTVLSFFLPPYNSVRRVLDRIVEPMLAPIRRVVPPIGGFDFSPLILLILIEIIASILNRILSLL